jgi:hypothetical protein
MPVSAGGKAFMMSAAWAEITAEKNARTVIENTLRIGPPQNRQDWISPDKVCALRLQINNDRYYPSGVYQIGEV